MIGLDEKLNLVFNGKTVRKDLLHRIKKGTNVPTFVLEFLLAKYCASNDPDEIKAGMEAVLSTLQENYVRPDESNLAQSRVATLGKHRFIDKAHVRYSEHEKTHWAELENFNSKRIAISPKLYKDHDRLLEGGLWAEVLVAHNDLSDDKFAFYIDELKPIQLSRFDINLYNEGRLQFTRDEWLDIIIKSVGLAPEKLSKRVKFHFIERLAPLVEVNYNFIELGPRGTGKSYFFSEFSPYSTLVSGGQATKSTLFYNNARGKIGMVGFWDTVAFDEVGGIKVKDPDTIQIMKDFMANGRFSRGVEVIADASMAFVGNIDHSIEQIVNSFEYDLFLPLPPQFDLAVLDRFYYYLPGWEMPKNSSEFLTNGYGLITDYIAEAFHYLFKNSNRFEEVNKRIKLGRHIEGRDEKAIKKTICAFLKILHPSKPPTDEEFEEYVAYSIEGRRRIKEQMNKRKPDEEFANIHLSYFDSKDNEIIVFCPESKNAPATQKPNRTEISPDNKKEKIQKYSKRNVFKEIHNSDEVVELKEKHITIKYGDSGYSYEFIFVPYLKNAKEVVVEETYLRSTYQVQNLVRFLETLVRFSTIKKILLITKVDDDVQKNELDDKLSEIRQSLLDLDIIFDYKLNENLHDREIRFDNGWTVKIGRGLDFYQKPNTWFEIGSNDLYLRKCLETKVDIFQTTT